jgi:hypothetical protein
MSDKTQSVITDLSLDIFTHSNCTPRIPLPASQSGSLLHALVMKALMDDKEFQELARNWNLEPMINRLMRTTQMHERAVAGEHTAEQEGTGGS